MFHISGDFAIEARLDHRPPSVLDANVGTRGMKLVRLHDFAPIPFTVFLQG